MINWHVCDNIDFDPIVGTFLLQTYHFQVSHHDISHHGHRVSHYTVDVSFIIEFLITLNVFLIMVFLIRVIEFLIMPSLIMVANLFTLRGERVGTVPRVSTVSINCEDFQESFLTCSTCLCEYLIPTSAVLIVIQHR